MGLLLLVMIEVLVVATYCSAEQPSKDESIFDRIFFWK